MAEGAWVPAFDSLWGSPKTQKLARRVRDLTKVPGSLAVEVAGAKFLKLMAWMRENVSSGDLGPVDRAAIAVAVGIASTKDPHDRAAARGQAFYEWLVDAEFVMSDSRGHVKGWEEGPGRLVATRESDRLRKEHDRIGHPTPTAGCPTCRRTTSGASNKPVSVEDVRRTPPPITPVSGGQRPAPRTDTPHSADRPADVRRTARSSGRTETTGTTEQTEQGTPQPPAHSRGQDAESRARQVLEEARGRWRDALQTLLIAGMTTTNLGTFFGGTTLEERGDWAIVRVPNAFAREWLETKHREPVARALGIATSRVIFATVGQDVVLEPEPVEDDA